MSTARMGYNRSDIERCMRHYGVSYEEAKRGLEQGIYTLPERRTGVNTGRSQSLTMTIPDDGTKNLNYIAGAAGGALLGACVAGVPGAIVGGILGLIFGDATCKKQ